MNSFAIEFQLNNASSASTGSLLDTHAVGDLS